jgi:hypothetical protein
MFRDFLRMISGKDYFHLPQKLGMFVTDPRCYYNDLRNRTEWNGEYSEGVPLLYVPNLKKSVEFPVMILQFGLGNLDRYFLEKKDDYLIKVVDVTKWIISNINENGYFNNYLSELDPQNKYFSNNSSMTQGEALSFLIRVVKYQLLPSEYFEILKTTIERIFCNMILPVSNEGTMLNKGNKRYFLEFCTSDENVVLNGWIFSIFGLYDYWEYAKSDLSKKILDETVETLINTIEIFIMKNGWTYYDMNGRIASPHYHLLHCSLISAMRLIFNNNEFDAVYKKISKANASHNKLIYTLVKISDKLKDKYHYTTEK